MQRVIYKYALELTPVQHVSIPAEARLLHLDVQDGKPTMWWSVPGQPVSDPSVSQRFTLVATGQAYDDTDYFVGTVLLGGFVFHVFTDELFIKEGDA